MKAKFVKDRLFEFERAFDDPDKFKDALRIGDPRARAKNILQKFAEDNGYDFSIRKNGNIVIVADGKKFSVTFPVERVGTEKPISLRDQSGQLMDRFSNGTEVAKRIEGNVAREKRARTRVAPPAEHLLNAIREGRVEDVKSLLSSGVSPNHSFRSKIAENIPLMVAVNIGNLQIVKALVHAGADVNIMDKHHQTPLGASMSMNSDFDIFKFLLDSGANPFLEPSLYWHLNNSSAPILKYFLEKTPKEEIDEDELIDILVTSVWMGNAKKAKALLDYGISPYEKRRSGRQINSFEAYEKTVGYLRDHEKYGDNYDYEAVEKLLDRYR